MLTTPKISLIIPVFNAEKHLAECLAGIRGQTLHDIEIICIDDGSYDNSRAMLQSAAAKDERIVLLTQNNMGSGAARNVGLERARGEFVGFIDADDLYPDSNTLEILYNTAVKHDALVCGGSFSMWRNGKIISDFSGTFQEDYTFDKEGFILYRDYQFDYGYHRFIFSKDLLGKNNIRFPCFKRYQDPPFLSRAMICAEKFHAITEVTYLYRLRDKPLEWSAEMIRDLIKGIIEELKISKENKLEKLHNLQRIRLNTEFFKIIRDFLDREEGDTEREQICRLLHEANETLDGDLLNTVEDNHDTTYMLDLLRPKASVIMPSLNVAPFIRQCMESVLNQSLKDIEIICVDAGSTDGTFEILQEYEKKDSRIRLIESEKKSYGHQMNLGLAAAKGLYVGIVETDDFVDPIMFEYLIARAEHFEADVVKSNYWLYSTSPVESDVFFELVPTLPYHRLLAKEEIKTFIFCSSKIWNGIYRRSFLLDNMIRFLDTPGASYQDTSFALKVGMSAKRIVLVPEALLHYRTDNENSSINSKGKIFCVCDEYGEVDKWMNERPNLKREFEEDIRRRRLETYRWNYFRLASDHSRATFLQRMHTELAGLVKERGWNPQSLPIGQRALLLKIVNNPALFLAENRAAPDSGADVSPLVSVVLALKAGPAPHLSECLATLQGQTLRDVEFLCICSDEPEGPLKTLEAHAAVDKRFVICPTGRDTDLGGRRNLGLDAAKGPYLFFAENRMFYKSHMLSRARDAAEQHGADVVLFAASDFDCKGRFPIKTNKYLKKDNVVQDAFVPDERADDLFQLTPETTWTQLYKRQYIEREGLRFPAGDHVLSPYFSGAALMLAGKIATLHEELAYVRVNLPPATTEIDPLATLVDEYDGLYRLCCARGKMPLLEATFCSNVVRALNARLASPEKEEREKVLDLLRSERLAPYRLFDRPPDFFTDSSTENILETMRGALVWRQRENLTSHTPVMPAQPAVADASAKVSVIMAVYNCEQYLDETLASICGQTLREIEILCVNDGSTDGSAAVLAAWAARDARIRVIEQANGGVSRARNSGADQATGEYLYYMDSDDLLDAEALEELYKKAKKDNLDILYFDAESFYDSECSLSDYSFKPFYLRYHNYGDIYTGQDLFEKMVKNHEYYVIPWLSFTKRTYMQKHNIRFFAGIMYEDNIFTFQSILQARRASHINKAFFHRRIRPGSLMTNKITFFNTYSYYMCGMEMLRFYFAIKETMSDSVQSKALSIIGSMFQFSADIFEKLDACEKGAQFCIGNDFALFNSFISSLANERTQRKENNKSLLQYNPVKNMERGILNYFAKCAECRIDVKLEGLPSHRLNVLDCGQAVRYQNAPWLGKDGAGLMFYSESGKINVTLQCGNIGILRLWLKGAPYKDAQGKWRSIPVDYQYFGINNKTIFDKSLFVSHDNPYCYDMPVKGGDVVTVYAECLPEGFKNCRSVDVPRKNQQMQIKGVDDHASEVSTIYVKSQIEVTLEGALSDNLTIIACNSATRHRDVSGDAEQDHRLILQSDTGRTDLTLKCEKAGVLKIWLKCVDVRDDRKQSVPIWMNCRNFTLNRRKIIDGSCYISRENPFYCELDVKDGEVVTMHASCMPVL